MSIPLLHGIASVLVALAMTTAAMAAESSGASHSCAMVVEPNERLACYDTAFPPASDARSGAIDVAAERAKALREFGLNKVQLSVREPERMRDITPDRIEAKVARVSARATGERVVTLDNDQIWLLTEVRSKGQLRSGDPIVVRTAALGTYMLVTAKGIALRARRIK